MLLGAAHPRSRQSSNLAPLSQAAPCRLSSQHRAPSGLPRPTGAQRACATSTDAAKSKLICRKESAAAEKTAAVPAAQQSRSWPTIARPGPLRLWPAIVSDGANGRVVRIGAYGSRLNAKKGWQQIVSRYPGMRRLKAVVAPVPAPGSGKTYYRLQFGTTSQAHSEVLCQRMRAIRKTCTVVGLPPRSTTQTKSVRR